MNIELKNICMYFSRKKVLDGVNITFEEGKIHALLGDNGAGKSTLANILNGELKPTSGSILLDGKETLLKNAKQAIQHGIAYVHQTPVLAESISIQENVMLGLDRKTKAVFQVLSKNWLGNLEPTKLVKDVGSDTKFFIALLSALLKNPKFLILDEPTALLDEEQRDYLFENLKSLAASGLNILIITHNFDEAEKYCNSIVRLEDGKIIDFSLPKEAKISPGLKKNYSENLTFTFENLTARPLNTPAIFNAGFSVSGQEIVLIKGLPEDGLLTLENLITGFYKDNCEGKFKITQKGNELYSCSLKSNLYSTKTLRKGVLLKDGSRLTAGIIPTDRKNRASNPNLTIEQIIKAEIKDADLNEIIKLADIDIQPWEKAVNLSGGMLQRLILTRELYTKPKLLILCQPLQGLDVRACEITCEKIVKAAEEGAAVIILSSSDFTSVLCNQKFVLKNGKMEKVK